jgi:hypothetical protein
MYLGAAPCFDDVTRPGNHQFVDYMLGGGVVTHAARHGEDAGDAIPFGCP